MKKEKEVRKTRQMDSIFFLQKIFMCVMSGYGIFWGYIFMFGSNKINVHLSLIAAIIMGIATYILVDKVGE